MINRMVKEKKRLKININMRVITLMVKSKVMVFTYGMINLSMLVSGLTIFIMVLEFLYLIMEMFIMVNGNKVI